MLFPSLLPAAEETRSVGRAKRRPTAELCWELAPFLLPGLWLTLPRPGCSAGTLLARGKRRASITC